jgi:hypothetical protein
MPVSGSKVRKTGSCSGPSVHTFASEPLAKSIQPLMSRRGSETLALRAFAILPEDFAGNRRRPGFIIHPTMLP